MTKICYREADRVPLKNADPDPQHRFCKSLMLMLQSFFRNKKFSFKKNEENNFSIEERRKENIFFTWLQNNYLLSGILENEIRKRWLGIEH